MSPVFAASRRRLADLQREWERLSAGNQLLDVVRNATGYTEADKAWVVNAAISSGVSGLYTGMEDVLRGLLSLVDGFVPSGADSHALLLDQASVAVEGRRPALITADVYDALLDLKGFRHFERHNYRFRFDGPLVSQNEAKAEGLVPCFIKDIEAFIAAMSDPGQPHAGPGR